MSADNLYLATPKSDYDPQDNHNGDRHARVARLAAAFGVEAADRLARSTVGVVGAGGTGSPAIEILTRAGVGHVIAVDPDIFAISNLERVHGSTDTDTAATPPKVTIAHRHATSINPKMRFTAIEGRLPQPEVIDALVHADVVLGCTDQQHSRLALSDLAVRYLVPVIDSGVGLEGADGRVTGQVIQLLRLLPTDPCALCRSLTDPVRVAQELMSEEERIARCEAAVAAVRRGESGNPYWHHEAQINTVGYLTTAAGALAAGYAIGWITNRFSPPFSRLQMNLSAEYFGITDEPMTPLSTCSCQRVRGWADQGDGDAYVNPPPHWPQSRQTVWAPVSVTPIHVSENSAR